MRRLVLSAVLAVLGTAILFSTASAQHRRLVNAVTIGPGASIWPGNLVDSTVVLPNRGGTLYDIVTAPDSASADSIASEIIPFAGINVTAGGLFNVWAPVDLDNSNGPKLDGWLLATLDSTALVTPGNLTPTSVAGPHYPYRISSLVVAGQYLMPSGSLALPGGAMAGQFGFGTTNSTDRTKRIFAIPVSDGFSNTIDGLTRFSLAIINRHPRISFTHTVYYVASSR